MAKFYITTPLYYVNASPHIGHAYTNIISDCLARFKRSKGDEVFFLTGTDEHGEKIKQAAEARGLDVARFVDEVSGNFKDLWAKLNVSYDFFIRTTQDQHREAVKKVINILNEKGDIYKADYRSFYCVPCESFWTPKQAQESGSCPSCQRPLEEVEEKNYFFRLAKYEGWLKAHLKDNPDCIQPKIRYNEVKGFLDNNPLVDLCISRPKARVSWGIDFPLDPSYVVYVWFDALLNYITAPGFASHNERFSSWWPADVQFMAKDILMHHAVFWPIMVHALGLEPPRTVFAHGWWKMGQEKMSKSLGNIVDPQEVIKQIGVDGLRYFLLREIPLGADGNYSGEALIHRVNSDLANDLGNLVYRTLNMAEKYFQGKVSPPETAWPECLGPSRDKLRQDYAGQMDSLNFSRALELVFNFVGAMNKYIEDTKPWVLWKEKQEGKLASFLYALLEGIRQVAWYLYPFTPESSRAINRQLGLGSEFSLKAAAAACASYQVNKEKPLFPRIDVS